MNSKLFYNEDGRLTTDCMRPCAKSISNRFLLPSSPSGVATIYVVAQKMEESSPALSMSIGGVEYSLDTSMVDHMGWLSTAIDAASLHEGNNVLTVPAQAGWSIAHDPVTDVPVIRLRATVDADGAADDELVLPRYGDHAIEAHREEWLALLPEPLRVLHDRWQWCWELAGFLAAAWPYANETDDCCSYAPWDARIILRWGRAGLDDNGDKPIAMCVHYAVCFVQFCIAMGVPARAVVLSPDLDSPNGHFIAEVWLDEFQSWAMIDPNLHLCYRDPATARPLAVADLSRRRSQLRDLAQLGEGFQAQQSRLGSFAEEHCLSGEVYRFWGVWGRHDWIENAQFAPPAHGAVPYAETDIIWCDTDEAAREALGMFPHFLSAQQLALSPAQEYSTSETHS